MKWSNKRIAVIGAALFICAIFIMPVSAADSNDEDYWLAAGWYSYYLNGKYDEALEAFDKVISINPENAAAYHDKGVVYYTLGEYDNALEQFQMSMSHISWFGNPYSRGYLWEYTGKTLDELGRYNDAVPAYEESLRFAPKRAEIWESLVKDLQLTGDYANSTWIQQNVYMFYDNGTVGADIAAGKEYLSTRAVHNTSAYYGEKPSGQAAPLTTSIIALIGILVIAAGGGAYLHARKNK